MGQLIRSACGPINVGSSSVAIYLALEWLFRVEVGHMVRIIGRNPRASLRKSVLATYVHCVGNNLNINGYLT